MKILAKVGAGFDRTLDLLALLACSLVFIAMVLVTIDVVTRYIVGHSALVWTVEVGGYIILYITFLATAWLLKSDRHVKMDMVVSWFRTRTQALINTITSIVGTIICLTLAWLSSTTTYKTFQSGLYLDTELKPEAYILHAVVAFGFWLLFIQFVRRSLGYLRSYRAAK